MNAVSRSFEKLKLPAPLAWSGGLVLLVPLTVLLALVALVAAAGTLLAQVARPMLAPLGSVIPERTSAAEGPRVAAEIASQIVT